MHKVLSTDIFSTKFKQWIPVWVVMIVIFMFSSIPGQVIVSMGINKESYHVDGHFILFFALGVSMFKAVKNYFLSLQLTMLYGFLDEIHQYFVPLRSVSLKDIVVDSIAGATAMLVIWKLQHILPKKLKNWLLN